MNRSSLRVAVLSLICVLLASAMPAQCDPASSPGSVTIGTGVVPWMFPLASNYPVSRTQTTYLASEIGAPCRIKALSLDVTTVPGLTLTSFLIRLKHLSPASFPTRVWESADWTVVYQADESITSTGWRRFVFSTPFDYNGTDCLMVDISFYNSAGTTNGMCRYTYLSSLRTLAAHTSNLSIYGPPTSWTNASVTPGISGDVPNIKLQVESTTTVFSVTLDPDGGVLPGPSPVTLSCATPDAAIHYTLNGDDPTENDPAVAPGATVLVTPPCTLKAKAWAAGLAPSAVKSASYRLPITVYVSPAGSSDNDGLSWATAKASIVGAMSAVLSGDTVWVAKGTYSGPAPLKNGVRMYGGFVGNETDLSQRPAFPRPAQDPNASVLRFGTPSTGGYSPTVSVASGSTAATVLDGFAILSDSQRPYSGGIYCNYASPTITNNTISGLRSGQYCPGIRCISSSAVIKNNTITGNISELGSEAGGISCTGGSPTIIGNTISGNSGLSGGGIFYSAATPVIQGNTITGNVSNSNGGGICGSGSGAIIANNVIAANSAPANGGAVAITNSTGLVFANNTVAYNRGNSSGGLYLAGTQADVRNNIVAFNSSGITASTANISLGNNDVFGNNSADYTGITAGASDISVYPQLADPWSGNFHIQNGSPCVDAGDGSVVGPDWTDIDGQARILPAGGKVDIGADESNGDPWFPIPVIVKVKPDGDDANDGSTWALAKKTVQAGIDAASATGSQVWVAAGTYKERIRVRLYVSVYGGFAGTENSMIERKPFPRPVPDLAETILDGEKKGSVVTMIGVGPYSVFDGFTIVNGTGSSWDNSGNDFYPNSRISGGGILCVGGSPAIIHNTIRGCSAGYGGGIYLNSSGARVLENIIKANRADTFGAGIYAWGSSPQISRNLITGNISSWVGGICIWRSYPVVISENTISGNTTSGNGGGLTTVFSNCTITNNTVSGNTASNRGGGLDIGLAGTCTVNQNVISNNRSYDGGGVWLDAGQYYGTGDVGPLTVNLNNNTIANNSAAEGGGIMCINGLKGEFINNIVAFNSSGIYSGGCLVSPRSNDLYNPAGPNSIGIAPGQDNIAADPKFVNASVGNYHLQPGSPCIDLGWNFATGLPSFDIDGQTRIRNGTVDMGADEYWPTPGDARRTPDGQPAEFSGAVVTAVFPDYFYVESPDRAAGIRVNKQGHGFRVSDRVDVNGFAYTNEDGEHLIQAGVTTVIGSGWVKPVAVSNRGVGGGTTGSQGAVWSWTDVTQPDHTIKREWRPASGLTNIGLLIKTTGKVTYAGGGFFYIDDGSALDDGSGYKGVKVYGKVPVAPGVDPVGKHVTVIGVSSCEKPGNNPVRVIWTPYNEVSVID